MFENKTIKYFVKPHSGDINVQTIVAIGVSTTIHWIG